MRSQEATIKRRSAVLAGLLVLVMLLTGTWAWQRFNQRAFNPYVRSHSEEELGRNFGGRLHNDFKWYDNGTHNKDIYAENFGEEEIFVRIQLREFLTLDGTPVGDDPSAISINDLSTWPIYNSDENDVTIREEGTDAALIGAADRIVWRFGGDKIFMPTFNQATHESIGWRDGIPAPFNHNTAYRMTNATGNAVDAIAGGFDISTVYNVYDVIAHGVQTGPGTTVEEGRSEGYGGQNDWNLGDERDYPVLRVGEDGYLYLSAPEQPHVAKPTLEPEYGGIMTMRQWRDNDEPRGNFWVLDTEHEGGWFYWADPLQPTEATSLLLNEVTINEQSGDLEYIITPMVDFVTRDYIYRLPQLSEDAKDLWDLDGGTPDLEIPGIDETFTENDIEWRVIAEYGDYALIMTEHVHLMGTRFHSENLNPTVIFEEAEIRTALNTWFDTYAAPDGSKLREIAMDYEFTNGARTEPGAGRENGGIPNVSNITADAQWRCSAADAFTTCDQTDAIARPALGTQGNGEVFIPTLTEINTFVGTTNADRAATTPEGNLAQYWLRSPGNPTTHSVRIINTLGNLNVDSATSTLTSRGSRPALWVSR